jgi:microcystin degradation protein MlrC
MLEEVNGGRTDIGPMIARLERARDYEQRPDVFAVSINAGFGNADIRDAGPTVLVTGQGDLAAHGRFAEDIADDIWDRRHEVLNRFLPVEDAVRDAKAALSPAGLVIIADYADNPGGGAYGDGTALLSAMLDGRLENACFGPLVDPEAARILATHALGETASLDIGGKTDLRFGGGPIRVSGTVMLLSNGDYVGDGPMMAGLAGSWGATAVLRVSGIDILIVSLPAQMLDLQQFRAFGIDPASKSVVALKSMQHFRAAFAPIASHIIICDSGALCTPDLRRLQYEKVRRPIFPLDAL